MQVATDGIEPQRSVEYAYWAFMSYSHADGTAAKALHRALETYRIPRPLVGKHSPLGPIPKRIAPIFRDEDELSSGPSLPRKISSALQTSRVLILLCSPRSYASTWVNREIETFAALGRADRIFAVLVEGEGANAFPPALRAVQEEPLAADLRDLRPPTLRAAMLRVIAGIFDLSYDALVGRDQAREKRRRRLFAALGAAAIVAGSVGYTALADMRIDVPGAAAIRISLDSHDLSVFRHVPSDRDVAASLEATRASLLAGLEAAARTTKFTFDDRGVVRDEWTAVQAASAAFARPSDSPAANADFGALLFAGFDPRVTGSLMYRGSVPYGWCFNGMCDQGQSVAWTALALSEALAHGRFAPAAHARLMRDRALTEAAMRAFGPNPDGSWNQFPNQLPESTKQRLTGGRYRYATYTSVVMYQTLLASREANLAWNGSIAERDRERLHVRSFFLTTRGPSTAHGWLPDAGYGVAPGYGSVKDYFEGLDAQILATLLRDERTGGPAIPPDIAAYIGALVPTFESRGFGKDERATDLRADYFDRSNHLTHGLHPEAYRWYPWGVALAAEWYAHLSRSPGIPHAQIVETRRGLAHLVIDEAPLVRESLQTEAYWGPAETAYGLSEALNALPRTGTR